MKIKRRALYIISTLAYMVTILAPAMSVAPKAAAAGIGDPMVGRGTFNYPYRITDCSQLQDMNQDLSAYYVLMSDINCSATSGWNEGAGFLPVGTSDNKFTGSLDGRNHTVTGLTISRSSTDNVGLISYAHGATIKNLKLLNATITGHNYVAPLAANVEAGTSIDHASANSVTSGGLVVGGLVGYIENSSINFSSVTGSATNTIAWGGGLAAYTTNTDMTNNYVSATLTGANTTGGLTGDIDSSSGHVVHVTNNYFAGSITDANYASGLVGFIDSADDGGVDITGNFVSATLNGSDQSVIYGVLGGGGGTPTITNNHFDANVLGNTTHCAHGAPISGCIAENSDGNNSGIWQLGDRSAPLDSWTFDATDWSDSSGYPTLNDNTLGDLNPVGPPYPPAGFTVADAQATRVKLAWEEPLDGGYPIDHYNVSYKKHSASSWTSFGLVYAPKVTIDGLNPLTRYDFRVTTTNSFGTSVGYAQTTLTTDNWQDINVCDDLFNIGDNPDASYRLTQDLDCSFTQHVEGGFNQISGDPFSGILDGQGHVIHDLWQDTGSGSGIFQNIDGGVVENLSIDRGDSNAEITGDNVSGVLASTISSGTINNVTINEGLNATSGYAGLLAGQASCNETGDITIESVVTDGNLVVIGSSGYGGLIGHVEATSGCKFTVSGSSSYMDYWVDHVGNTETYAGNDVGGLIGDADINNTSQFTVDNSYFAGNLHDPGSLVGGLIGYISAETTDGFTTATVKDSQSFGDITGNPAGEGIIGGLIGKAENGVVLNRTYSSGNISGDNQVGGLVGYAEGQTGDPDTNMVRIMKSYSVSTITDTAETNGLLYGGLVGQGTNAIISNSYYSGIMDMGDALFAGGLAGDFTGDIINSYATGKMNMTDGSEYVGGLAGSWEGSHTTNGSGIINSFAAVKITGNLHVEGNVAGGLVGYDAGMSNLDTDYYDPDYTGMACGADQTISPEDCGHASVTDFIGNHSQAPLDKWHFDSVWAVQCGDYPTLQWEAVAADCNVDNQAAGGSDSGSTEAISQALTTSSLSLGPATSPAGKTITLNDFSGYNDGNGKQLKGLTVGQVIHFDVTINGVLEHHTATVKEIGKDYVIFSIHSKAFNFKVRLGQTRVVTIGGYQVMQIGLDAINGASADVTFAKVKAAPGVCNGCGGAQLVSSRRPIWPYILVAVILVGAVDLLRPRPVAVPAKRR